MANGLYSLFKEDLLNKLLDLNTDTIKVQLIDTANYTVALTTHHYYSEIAAGARIGTATTLATPTIALGVFDAANTTITAVTGATVEALVIYQAAGTEGTSILICYIDTASQGLPFTPNGGDVTITWNASGIFAL